MKPGIENGGSVSTRLETQSWPQKRKAIIIAKYMEDSVVKSVDILLKDNKESKEKLHQNQTKNKRSIPENILQSYNVCKHNGFHPITFIPVDRFT
jgi:hypothetical protein